MCRSQSARRAAVRRDLFQQLAQKSRDSVQAPIIKRCIHTSADFDYAENLCFSEQAVEKGLDALRRGACTESRMIPRFDNSSSIIAKLRFSISPGSTYSHFLSICHAPLLRRNPGVRIRLSIDFDKTASFLWVPADYNPFCRSRQIISPFAGSPQIIILSAGCGKPVPCRDFYEVRLPKCRIVFLYKAADLCTAIDPDSVLFCAAAC